MQYQNKDPRGSREFCVLFSAHSPVGSANTLRGVQAKRPTIYSLGRALARLKVPTHIVTGDEDTQCVEPGVFIKRTCAAARLTIVPATGHAVNVEEPDLFNRLTAEFLSLVDSGQWRPRDPRARNKPTRAGKR